MYKLNCAWLALCIPETDGANGQSSCYPEGTGRGSYQVRGMCLTIKQFFALLIKRLHHATRSCKDFFAQVNHNHNLNSMFMLKCCYWSKSAVVSVVFSLVSLKCCIFYVVLKCHLCLCLLVDRFTSQFYFPGADIHSDRSTFWRISKPDPHPMDVWETVHIFQVSILDTRSSTSIKDFLIEF